MARDNAGPIRERPEESVMHDLARVAPNSGGLYFDEGGNLVAYSAQANENAAIRSHLAQLLRGTLRDRARKGSAIIVRPGRFTFRALAVTRDSIFASIFNAMPGISTLDLDERQNRVLLGLEPSTYAQTASAVAARLRELGLDTASVVMIRQAAIVPTGAANLADSRRRAPGNSLFAYFDTIVGGLSMDTWDASNTNALHSCTVGFPAIRNSVAGFVTVTHCTELWGASDNAIARRSIARIGDESVDPAKYTCGLNYCRQSDAAFFSAASGVPMGVGLIARALGANNTAVDTLNPYFIITSVDNNTLIYGEGPVYKVGVSSGLTYGTVNQTCVDHHWPQAWPTMYTTTCLYGATTGVLSGDSGGPFLSLDGSGVKLLGIVTGTITGSSVFTKASRIFSELGGSWTVTRGFTLSAPSVSGSVVSGYPAISWSAISGATRYDVFCSYVTEEYDEYSYPYIVYHDEWVGTVSGTSFTDSAPVDSYTGSSEPYYYRTYRVVSNNGSDLSTVSNRVSFSFTP